MTKVITSAVCQPSFVKYLQDARFGVQPQVLSRHSVGYVLRGQKLIHYGDTAYQANPGDMFYLPAGHHYIENIPERNQPFEQIVVYFTPEQFNRCLTQLSVNFGLVVFEHHVCDNCRGLSHVIFPAWSATRRYFQALDYYISDGEFENDPTTESLKMMELVYLIVSNSECCIQSKILEHSDVLRESFEQIINNHIFADCSIDDLARLTNRSLTSFKKEFSRQFHESPHKWIIRQRLMHARLLLISTSKSVAEIGAECNFPNTSHFIKLFKKEFNLTPSVYRNRHNERKGAEAKLKVVE